MYCGVICAAKPGGIFRNTVQHSLQIDGRTRNRAQHLTRGVFPQLSFGEFPSQRLIVTQKTCNPILRSDALRLGGTGLFLRLWSKRFSFGSQRVKLQNQNPRREGPSRGDGVVRNNYMSDSRDPLLTQRRQIGLYLQQAIIGGQGE